MFTVVATGMSALTNFHLGATILAAAAGGLAADVLILRLRPSPTNSLAYRVVAGPSPEARRRTRSGRAGQRHGLS